MATCTQDGCAFTMVTGVKKASLHCRVQLSTSGFCSSLSLGGSVFLRNMRNSQCRTAEHAQKASAHVQIETMTAAKASRPGDSHEVVTALNSLVVLPVYPFQYPCSRAASLEYRNEMLLNSA